MPARDGRTRRWSSIAISSAAAGLDDLPDFCKGMFAVMELR